MIFFPPKIQNLRFYPGMNISLLVTQASVSFTPGKQHIQKCQYCHAVVYTMCTYFLLCGK